MPRSMGGLRAASPSSEAGVGAESNPTACVAMAATMVRTTSTLTTPLSQGSSTSVANTTNVAEAMEAMGDLQIPQRSIR
ncbi:hypothetical protein GUJ93_ZPchr0013g34950 [Zizania palustris]|uniref:Uncharacterized protein n=1 Tax=Zizania palustris TaxID=103762 RepID=A0A8J6BXK8_ZIZPA|nr:hypothetical protein GUJ93_ZPchr0013g34950 [Zizania palustris]